MTRLLTAAATAVSLLGLAAAPALANGKEHYIAIHVDQNDPHVMNMALNNAKNVEAYYKSKGDSVTVEVVAYGPGLNMLVAGKSPVADRVAQMSLAMDHLRFSACNNTLQAMQKKVGHPVKLLSEAQVVPSGVVRLTELQEEGYSYVRP
ncbi:DsrE family protein [Acidimangrovimonas pyrenivorans]|uniref:DsrE family protein n=1 Tax=Acidimangrovimonas pyrenivorans TaxID=2030798 RepID=A0ABV7ALK2_9RHOB